MKRNPLWLCVLAVATLAGVLASSLPVFAQTASEVGPWAAKAMDWPYWRGPEMNGISREKNLVNDWTPNRGATLGKNVLWFNKELGSRSTPIVMNGKLYTLVRDQPETKTEGEKVICVDAATGKKLWESRFNVFLSDVPDTRVAWSSVCGDPQTGDVFALGVCGYFQCLDGETGKTKWSHSLSEEYGLLSTYGGRTNFPIVHGNLVIISAVIIGWGDMAKPAHRFIAFDKRNGQPVWFRGTRLLPFDTTYSAPVITVHKGEPQMIFASGDGALHGFQPQTGKSLWSYQISTKRGVNTAPLVVGNMVFCGHAEENVSDTTMGALFAVDLSKKGLLTKQNGGEIWRQSEWTVGRSSPLYINGFLYAIDNGTTLRIVEAKTGKLIEKISLGGPMNGSPLYADGKIYLCTQNGRWWTFEPQKDGKLKTLYKSRLDKTEVQGSVIVSHGRMYVPTTAGLYCIGKKDQKPSADPRPAFPKEADPETDATPVELQVVPVESLLRPDQKQQFQVRLYNSRGQFLRMAEPGEISYALTGPGNIDKAGKYVTDPKNKNHYAVSVTAKVGKLSGAARVRVVPDLPWSVDFNNGEIPITWVGARYRHVPLDYDLYTDLKDKRKNLLAARVYVYLQSGFANGQPGGQPGSLMYNNKSPKRTFTDLLRYLDLDTKITTLEQAKDTLNPPLQLLAAEKILGSHSWSESPVTGIQLNIKQGTRKITGNGVMTKISTIPLGQRSQGWMGHTDFKNYTIQADVQGADRVSEVKRGMTVDKIVRQPDIGLSAQRYALVMQGASQKLEIRTWHPQLRMAKSVPFQWKSHVWYTLKLQASVEGGKAMLRGKCWKRGDKEPADWNLVAEDESPNLEGSPGLYGDASNAEIFYDNLKVYPNP